VHSEIRLRFQREGYAANALKHPGAVTVLDDDVGEDGVAFLVMELLEGETVDAKWRRCGRRLDLRAALDIGCQVLDVLAAAHARGVVHRDIKPANLFLTTDGRLKALDFGIARLTDTAALAGGAATQTGMMVGTPAFMAPEQAQGKASEVDGQTDIWAVGATLFALVSGRAVHEASTAQQILLLAATTPAPPLASFADQVPPAIARVVDRALAYDKAERWPSAAAMAEALRDASTATFGSVPSAPDEKSAPSASIARAPNRSSAETAYGRPNSSPMELRAPLESLSSDKQHQASPLDAFDSSATRRHAGPRKRVWLVVSAASCAIIAAAGLEVRLSSEHRTRATYGAGEESRANESASALGAAGAPVANGEASALPPSTPPSPTTSPSEGREVAMRVSAPRIASTGSAKPKGVSTGERQCSPNYVFDSDGNKHFKPECF
jgi:serine/threonine-protein kinase